MSLSAVLNRLKGFTGSKGQFRAKCPCDSNHHIKVIEGEAGRIYLKCLHHHEHEIIQALNLPFEAIFPNNFFFKVTPKHSQRDYDEAFLDLIQRARLAGERISESDKKREREVFMSLRKAS